MFMFGSATLPCRFYVTPNYAKDDLSCVTEVLRHVKDVSQLSNGIYISLLGSLNNHFGHLASTFSGYDGGC